MPCRCSLRSTAGSRPGDPPLSRMARAPGGTAAVDVRPRRRGAPPPGETHEPPVLAADAARHDVPEPRVDGPDVPVQLGARLSERLASGPPGRPGARRVGPDH